MFAIQRTKIFFFDCFESIKIGNFWSNVPILKKFFSKEKVGIINNVNDSPTHYAVVDLYELHRIFSSLPTHMKGKIRSTDFPELARKIGLNRTKEQVQAIKAYFDEHYGGKLITYHLSLITHNIHRVPRVRVTVFQGTWLLKD